VGISHLLTYAMMVSIQNQQLPDVLILSAISTNLFFRIFCYKLDIEIVAILDNVLVNGQLYLSDMEWNIRKPNINTFSPIRTKYIYPGKQLRPLVAKILYVIYGRFKTIF